MKQFLFIMLMATVSIIHCRGALAVENGDTSVVSSKYVIRSLGAKIGTVNARMSGSPSDNELRADVDVKAGFLFFRFTLKSSETATIHGGKVTHYRKTMYTGRKHREIEGEVDGDVFAIVVRDGIKVVRKEFSAKDYEVTNMEYPEVELAPGEERRMRVLDLENSEVVDRVYRFVAEEQAEIDGHLVRVFIADLVDKNSECRRWTAVINGLPVVRRQEGKEKTGLFNPSYSVRQIEVSVVQ